MVLSAALGYFISVALAEEDTKKPPIAPDRPNFANGTLIVPKGRVVVETGYRQSLSSGGTAHDYGDSATIRFAQSDKLEWRIGIPSYVVAGDSKGWADTSVGFKYHLSDAKGKTPALGILGTVVYPSGSNDFREKKLQPEVRLLSDFNLSDDIGLTTNIVYGLPSEGGNTFSRWAVAAALGFDLHHGDGAFAELYSVLPDSFRGSTGSVADVGVSHLLSNDCSLDAFYGHGLNSHSRDSFFGGGVSFRF